MWLLPELVCGDRKWRLPLSDRLVAWLVLALGEPGRSSQVAALAKLLGRFPPLALWTVGATGRWDQLPPASVNALADGLLDVLLDAAFRLEQSHETSSATGVLELPSTSTLGPTSAGCERLCAEGMARCVRAGLFAPPTAADGCPAWLVMEGDLAADLANCPPAGCGADTRAESAASDAMEAALAAQWPSCLNRLRRQLQLERQFNEALEREKLASLRQLAYGAS
ncbi:MAG: hypothetical protein AB7O38_26090, partial [Pirellulaceae bacterium]